jgi:hypothetical protein
MDLTYIGDLWINGNGVGVVRKGRIQMMPRCTVVLYPEMSHFAHGKFGPVCETSKRK